MPGQQRLAYAWAEKKECWLTGSLGPVVAGTTNEQRALRAYLAARTPAAGQLGLTPGTAMLSTPHLQGLLQQLRISTPSLGAQVSCTCTLSLT